MDPDQDKTKLLRWEYRLYAALGAVMILLLFAVMQIARVDKADAWVWYTIWAIYEAAVLPMGFILLFAKNWRGISLKERLKPAFEAFSLAWLGLFAFGIMTGADPLNWKHGLMLPVILITASSVLWIAIPYIILKRRQTEPSEEMFP